MSCKTGDLILFSGTDWFSKFVEYFTNSNVSHVGIIVKDPPMNIINLYNLDKKESTFLFESVINPETNEYGVSLIPLRKRIQNYDGEVYIRFIENFNIPNEQRIRAIQPELKTEYQHGYDVNPIHFLECYAYNELTGLSQYLITLMTNPRRTDRVFCSALVAYCYSIMNLLEEDIQWGFVEPEYFESLKNLELGAKLSKPFRIVNDQDIINPETKSLSILCGDNLYQ